MPKVSIIAPVYGVEKYIEQFLDSIRSQTFQDIEVILVDDGSPDNCPAILDHFAETDDRYAVIHQKNGGVSAARNAGLLQATGEYVYIVDSDDWLEPTAIEAMVKVADETYADIIYGDWMLESDNGSTRMNSFPGSFCTEDKESIKKLQFSVVTNNNRLNISSHDFSSVKHMGGAPWRAMVRLAVIKENGLEYDPYVRGLGDDILFSLHLYEHINKVVYTQDVIYHYRVMQVSYSQGYKANYLETIERIYERIEQFLKDENGDELLYSAYYLRVLIYLDQGMQRYFKNKNNPASEKERYAEFKQVLKTEPYRTAIKRAPLNAVQTKRFKYPMCLLRAGLIRAYWILSKWSCR